MTKLLWMTILVTIDVSSPYTNINPEEGIEEIRTFLLEMESKGVPTEFLLRMLEQVLGFNIFEFDSKLYQQIIGTAMGTRVSPTFACIFMGWLEVKILQAWLQMGGVQPLLWRRYIDDILFSREVLKQS